MIEYDKYSNWEQNEIVASQLVKLLVMVVILNL